MKRIIYILQRKIVNEMLLEARKPQSVSGIYVGIFVVASTLRVIISEDKCVIFKPFMCFCKIGKLTLSVATEFNTVGLAQHFNCKNSVKLSEAPIQKLLLSVIVNLRIAKWVLLLCRIRSFRASLKFKKIFKKVVYQLMKNRLLA